MAWRLLNTKPLSKSCLLIAILTRVFIGILYNKFRAIKLNLIHRLQIIPIFVSLDVFRYTKRSQQSGYDTIHISCHADLFSGLQLNHFSLNYDDNPPDINPRIIFSGADNCIWQKNRSNYDTSNRFGKNTLLGSPFKKKTAGHAKFQYGHHFPWWPPRAILKSYVFALNGQQVVRKDNYDKRFYVLSIEKVQIMS